MPFDATKLADWQISEEAEKTCLPLKIGARNWDCKGRDAANGPPVQD